MRILRRIRNKSLVMMTMITVLLLGINFVLVEQHRQIRGKGDTGIIPVVDAREVNVTSDRVDSSLVTPYVPVNPPTTVVPSINVIMGYMRTGSSFLGNTMQEYDGTFYLYEPIRTIWEAFYYGKQPLTPIMYPNGSIIEHKLEDRDKVIIQEIKDYMSCNFANVSVMSLRDKFHRSKTKKMKNLKECTERYASDDNTSIPLLGIKEWVTCLEEARKLCLLAPIRLLKFIRLPLTSMGQLMVEFTNLKILHLHRDPRGVFNSRAQLTTTPQKATTEEVVEHCDQWFNDLETAKVMSEEYRDRYRALRYEDVTEQPVEAFTGICKYFNVPFEPVVKTYLTEITTADADDGPWEFHRANPYETAMKWRQQLSFERAADIGKLCEKPMKELNYVQFGTEDEMTNSELPVRGPLESGGPTWNVTEL